MDEPSDPFAMGVYLVSKLAAESVKVVIGGDGGDENFAGYDRFAGNRMVDNYCLLPEWIRKVILRKIFERIPETFGYKSFAQKARWVNEMSLIAGGERYAQSMSFLRFTQEAKESLFTESARRRLDRQRFDFEDPGSLRFLERGRPRGPDAVHGSHDPHAGSPAGDRGPDVDGPLSGKPISIDRFQGCRVRGVDPRRD